jgi:histidine ammonia-lyase
MSESTVYLDGETLTLTEVYMVAYHQVKVEVASDSWSKVLASRGVIERILRSGETVYGVNTGFGSLVNTQIEVDQLKELQRNLIRSHATAIGPAMEKEMVRAMMVIRLNSLCKGYSGVHPDVLNQIVDYLNHDITPHVPRIGSLGASGDLAPLSHIALSLIGEGYVLHQGERVPTIDKLKEKGLVGVELRAKDGLSLINGTSQMTAYLAISAYKLSKILPIADMIYCSSLDAAKGSATPLMELVHNVRPHPGQTLVARRMRKIIRDSMILESHTHCERVQDPYSFRCAPQVHGAVHESFQRLLDTLQIELNSSTDNPLVFPDTKNPGPHEIVSQGNFHGEIIGMVSDSMVLSLFELGSISERRMDQLLDFGKRAPQPFLANNAGLESGLMIVQYVAGASLSELHGQILPRTGFSTSTSAGQEDHVSMGATAAYNLFKATERISEILACELMIAIDAMEFYEEKSSPVLEELKKATRAIYPRRSGDISTSDYIIKIAEFINEGTWLSTIESIHGSLD